MVYRFIKLNLISGQPCLVSKEKCSLFDIPHSVGNLTGDCILTNYFWLMCHQFVFVHLCRIRSRGRRLRARDGVCCDQGQPSGPPLHRPVRRLLLQRPDGGRGPVLVDAVRRLHRIHQNDGLLQTEQPAVETQSFPTHDESA